MIDPSRLPPPDDWRWRAAFAFWLGLIAGALVVSTYLAGGL